jgi:hypothetical protein
VSQGNPEAREVEEGSISGEQMLMTDQQASELAKPGVGSFDDPTPLVAAGDCFRQVRTRSRTRIRFVSPASASQPNHAMAQRNNLAGIVAGVSTPEEEILGAHSWALGYLAVSCGTITDEMIQEYIEEQEGEQIADDGRFPIDNR